jgi:predicted nucleic acid-binding Zn ribbon protein
VDNLAWTLSYVPIAVRKRRENETSTLWVREATGVLSPLVHRLCSYPPDLARAFLALAVEAVTRDLGGGEVPTEPQDLEFVLKVDGPQVLPPSLESVLKLPWNPEEPGFAEAWERLLLRHGLPIRVTPADPDRPYIIRVPLGLLSCIRLLLEATLRASEGRPDDMRAAVSLFGRAREATRWLGYLVDPGVRPEGLASVDPLLSELRQEDLTGLAIAAIAEEGDCSGFLSIVHGGASRFLSPPTRHGRILAWGWFPYLAPVLTRETPQRRCRRCGAPVPEGHRNYCSARCSDTTRKTLYRARKRPKA